MLTCALRRARRNSKLRVDLHVASTIDGVFSISSVGTKTPHRHHRPRALSLSPHPHRRQPAGLLRPGRLQHVRVHARSQQSAAAGHRDRAAAGLPAAHLQDGHDVPRQPERAAGRATRRRSAPGTPSRKTFASSTMIVSGLWLLVFLVIHVKAFRYGPEYEWPAGGRDLYRQEMETLRQPADGRASTSSAWSSSARTCGTASRARFQSLGVDHPAWTPRVLPAGQSHRRAHRRRLHRHRRLGATSAGRTVRA